MDAATQAGGTAVSQGVELPQLVPQQVPQGCAADRAAEVGQQQVAAGAGGWGEVEGLIRGVAFCFHDGRQPGLLLGQQDRIGKKSNKIEDKCCETAKLRKSEKQRDMIKHKQTDVSVPLQATLNLECHS